jgi:Xaa-Pro aminopeptidase
MIAENALSGNCYTLFMRPKRPTPILALTEAPAMLVSNLTNIRFLTGVPLSSGVLLVDRKRMTLFTDGRYLEMASQKAYRGITLANVADLEHAMRSVRSCAVEQSDLTLDRFIRWKRNFKNTKFVQTSCLIEGFRRSKDSDEIHAFRRAQRITREIMRRVPGLLRRPMREIDVAWQIQAWAHELGADGMAFDSIVAFGTHTSRPHHRPTTRLLRKGHIVQIDCGARYGGYCADQSAVFFTGKPTPLQRRVYAAVCEAKDAAIAAIKPGVTVRTLDSVSRTVLKRYGLEQYFCHALGHGVGLEIHEGVTLSQKAKDVPLLKNEIITIEPGVYIPGRFGMRVEEEIVVL